MRSVSERSTSKRSVSKRSISKILALGLPVLAGASGCHTYKYVDMNVSFDQAIDDSQIQTIATCKVTVSGADSSTFYLDKCPNLAQSNPDPHTVGMFEYSTFADSGSLTFELKAYNGLNQTDACQLGLGTTTVPVTDATTLMGSMVVKMSGPGCANGNVTPPTDGSM